MNNIIDFLIRTNLFLGLMVSFHNPTYGMCGGDVFQHGVNGPGWHVALAVVAPVAGALVGARHGTWRNGSLRYHKTYS